MPSDEYANWRRRCNGEWLPVDPEIPDPGCYRVRAPAYGDLAGGWLPVHIWQSTTDDGEIVFRGALNGEVTIIANVWPRCADSPVTSAAYNFYAKNKRWPDAVDDPEPAGDNLAGAPEYEQVMATIIELEVAAIAWFESLGGEIKKQEDADRAQNYAEKFVYWEGQAAEKLKTVCDAPNREITQHRTNWKPVIARAEDCKATIKQQWLKPYLLAARDRQKAALVAEGRDPEKVLARPKAGSGAGKRSSITIREVAVITDIRLFISHLLGFVNVPDELQAVAQKIANKLVHEHVKDLPGVRIDDETSVR